VATAHHHQLLPYTPAQLYDLVADIEKYPAFLPGCSKARILSQSDTEVIAALTVQYGPFQETYTSRVHLTPKSRIDVEYVDGPFQHLKNDWTFSAAENNMTTVEFFIDFKFQNLLFQKASQLVFEKAFGKVMEAFTQRAHDLYGKN